MAGIDKLLDEHGAELGDEQRLTPTGTFVPDVVVEAQERRDVQQPLGDTFSEGLAPAFTAIKARLDDEAENVKEELFTEDPEMTKFQREAQDVFKDIAAGAISLFWTPDDPTYDREAHKERLLKDIPLSLQDNILEEGNLGAAERTRQRILADVARGNRLMQQEGVSPTLALLAAGVVDVDLPLTFMTGGGFKAAQVSRQALMLGKKAGLSPKNAVRVSSAGVGASSGLQAGAVVGVVEAAVRDTAEWTLVAESVLAGMALGGTLNPLLRGDYQLAVRNAREELYKNIREDAANLRNDVNVDDALASEAAPDLPTPVEGKSSVGAAATGNVQGAQRTTLDDPAGPVSKTMEDIITDKADWRNDSGWLDRKRDVEDDFWTKVALTPAFNLSTGNFKSLYTSESAVLNWLAGTVYESPNGLGRGKFTASAGMELYHRQIFSPIAKTVQTQATQWAKANNATWRGSGFGLSTNGLRQFNREVMLEMNARSLLGSHTTDVNVRAAADAYDEAGRRALSIAKGKPGQHSMDGFDLVPDKQGYTPYIWKGKQLLDLERSGVLQRDDVVNAMVAGYQTAGIAASKDARAVAKAVINRAIAKDVEDVDMNLIALLSGDGREFLRDALKRDGVSDPEIENIMQRITGNVEERGKEGFAKRRNDIDLGQSIVTQDGSDVKIVDLMDTDMHSTWQRYTRRVAGSAALARIGITNKAQREQIIEAAQIEQRSLGEDQIDGELLRSMFTHFNGGPVHGFFNGSMNKGVGAEIAIAKRVTNLALLGKVGMAQLAETGVAIAQVGAANWWRRGPAAAFSQELRNANRELLDDMAYVLGDLGYDHKHFAEWLDLDDVSRADRNSWINAAGKLTAQGQHLQGYTSLFNTVRSHQQRIAAMGMVDKVVRTVKKAMLEGDELSEGVKRRFMDDLGLDAEDIRELERLINDGTIEFGTRGSSEFVQKLNFEKWDADFAELFGSSITRNINQVVQKSMAGEQDAWMHTQWGSIMAHLKTFPLAAMQKQFIRNMRHTDEQTLATVLMGFGTAVVAIGVRDAVDGKERSAADVARIAFGYSNMTGWVPMFVDPTMTLLGFEDQRINAFGPHSDYTPPVITTLNRAARLPGAVADTLTGNDDWYDRQSLKALPFRNTLGMSRMFD